ncbi:MAG: hypothetical protein ABJN34_11815 [Litoreibacter sp.]|uniref:hypothetical protein n=1 Tax=Litoreibacter sp. TaxID=1969459 RepID=UPI00329A4829
MEIDTKPPSLFVNLLWSLFAALLILHSFSNKLQALQIVNGYKFDHSVNISIRQAQNASTSFDTGGAMELAFQLIRLKRESHA